MDKKKRRKEEYTPLLHLKVNRVLQLCDYKLKYNPDISKVWVFLIFFFTFFFLRVLVAKRVSTASKFPKEDLSIIKVFCFFSL